MNYDLSIFISVLIIQVAVTYLAIDKLIDRISGKPQLRHYIIAPGAPSLSMYIIYCIECNTPKHLYVGQSRQFLTRIVNHCKGKGARFTKRHGVKCYCIVDFAEQVVSSESTGRVVAPEGRRHKAGRKVDYEKG